MICKGSRKGMTCFSLKPGKGTKEVLLAGDFNDWKPRAMTKQKDGTFASNLTLASGKYEYKFVVDGRWQPDPDNNVWTINTFGTPNSVAQIS